MDVNHKDESYGGETPDILDNAYVIVDFRSGRRALLDLCMFAEGAYWQETIAATGDKGRAEIFIPVPPASGRAGERHSEIELSPRKPKGPKRRMSRSTTRSSRPATTMGPPTTSISASTAPSPRAGRGGDARGWAEGGPHRAGGEKSAKTGKAVPLAF